MDDLGTILSVNNWPGHLSYLLIAISYWLTNMFWLRVVAVVGLSLEIALFLAVGRRSARWHRMGPDLHLYKPLPGILACKGSYVATSAGVRSRIAPQRF